MNVAVFGATGATGRQLVDQALERGHHVRAFVRDPTRVWRVHPSLAIVQGDAMDPATIDSALHSCEAVLCALGTEPEGRADRARRQTGVPVCSTGTANILAAMARRAISRIIVESSASVGESRHTGRLGAAFVVRTLLAQVMADKERQEAIVRAGVADWTIIRPVRMSDGPRTGRARSGADLRWSLASRVSRADVASVMLNALGAPSTIRCALTVLA